MKWLTHRAIFIIALLIVAAVTVISWPKKPKSDVRYAGVILVLPPT